MLKTFQSSSAAERLGAASAFVERFPTATEVLIVGASRDAADDLARRVTAARRATFGLHRASLKQLAVRFAAEEMARLGVPPATAKEVGLFDEAIRLAKQTPCDPKTLTRAARDFADVRPEFAIEAGRAGQVRDRIRALVASETDGERFVTRTLSRTLGL